MGVSLTEGQSVSLAQLAPNLNIVSIGFGWCTATGEDFDLDGSALACGENGQVLSDQHFIFYNNLTSPDRSIHHRGDELPWIWGYTVGDDEEAITVELAAVPTTINHILFAISIFDADDARGLTFADVERAYVRVIDHASDTELVRCDLTGDLSQATAIVFSDLCRWEGEWMFSAVGQHYASGLAGVAREYGVNVE